MQKQQNLKNNDSEENKSENFIKMINFDHENRNKQKNNQKGKLTMQVQQNVFKLLSRPSLVSYNLDGQNAANLFKKLITRMKVHKVIQHWKKLSKNSLNRYRRIQQWIKTQNDYINDLKLIVQKIQKPLKQQQLITQQQERIIFPNMLGIIGLSQQMHLTMKEKLDKWHPLKTEIAPAVIKLSSFFKIYIQYFNNYLKGKSILDSIKNSPNVKAIQKTLKMDFDSYLSKPTQRPVKYKLLLTDYQKKLRKDHPDYNALTKAIKIYHQVVEKTNEALQNQKRTRRMIQIEKIFKNILQSSRQWKNEFQAQFQNLNMIEAKECKVHLFTDLILIISKGRKQQLIGKILLDGNSFISIPEQNDEKIKKIFVVGKQENGYFIFRSKYESDEQIVIQQRNKIFFEIAGIANSLHVNQWKRKQALSRVQSRRFSNFRVSRPTFNQYDYSMFDTFKKVKKHFRLTIIGVEKRIQNGVKNLYYVLKQQLPFPQVINQRMLVKFQAIIQLEKIVRNIFPKFSSSVKPITQIPKHLMKNAVQFQYECRLIDSRILRIQMFLNLILRSQQTSSVLNLFLYTLKLNQSIFQYIIDDKNECVMCDICQNGEIISNFESYKKQQQQRIQKLIQKKNQNFCTYRTFHVQNRLASHLKKNVRSSIDQIMLFINSKIGVINYKLLNRMIQGESIKFKVYTFHYSQLCKKNEDSQNFILVEIYKRDAVGHLLQQIRKKLKIDTIKDFGLLLKNNVAEYLLNQDQYIYDILKQNQINVEQNQSNNNKGIKGFFNKIKQSFQQKITKSMSYIYIKKLFIFSKQIQLLSCTNQSNLQRRSLICDQIFYRFKNKQLNIKPKILNTFVSYFIMMQKIKRNFVKKQDYPKLLQQLFNQKRYSTFQNSKDFLTQLYGSIKVFEDQNIKKIEYYQNKLIQLVTQQQTWNSFYVPVIKTGQKYTIQNQRNFLIGISYQFLTIRYVNSNSFQTFLTIPINQLKIKFIGLLIIIRNQDWQYKFYCENLFIFRYVLEKYQAYNKFFLGNQNKIGNDNRLIMEQTI